MRVFFSESPLIDNSIDYLRLDSHSKVVKVRKYGFETATYNQLTYGFETATYNQLTRKSCKNIADIGFIWPEITIRLFNRDSTIRCLGLHFSDCTVRLIEIF